MRATIISLYVQDDFRFSPNLTFNVGLRYESMTTPSEVNGFQNQITNHDTDTEVNVGAPYFEHPGHVFGPRLGLAWDIFGTGKTSLRIGYGRFNDMLLGNYWVNAVVNMPPLNAIGTKLAPDPATFPNYFPLNTVFNSALRSVPNVSLPTRQQWNLTLQQEVLPDTMVSIAYVGAIGRHEVRNSEANTALPTAYVNGFKCWGPDLCPARAGRRNSAFGSLLTTSTDGNSSYHSMQLNLRRRFSQGLQLQTNYTWGHGIDDGSQQWGTESATNPQNVTDLRDRKFDRGATVFDVRHNFSFNASYELPFGRDLNGAARVAAAGWSINSIVTLSSGIPISAVTTFNRANNIEIRQPDRPNLRAGANNNPLIEDPNHWFDETVFELPPQGVFGNLGRTTMRGPGFAQWDFGLFKNFDLSEEVGMQFRAEFFNILNRANFGEPQNGIFNSNGTFRSNASPAPPLPRGRSSWHSRSSSRRGVSSPSGANPLSKREAQALPSCCFWWKNLWLMDGKADQGNPAVVGRSLPPFHLCQRANPREADDFPWRCPGSSSGGNQPSPPALRSGGKNPCSPGDENSVPGCSPSLCPSRERRIQKQSFRPNRRGDGRSRSGASSHPFAGGGFPRSSS
jgi:hypothetical protein